MNLVRRSPLAAISCLVLAAFLAGTFVRAQDPPHGEGGMGMDPEMKARMMELATPGSEHAELAKMAGDWEQHYRFRWSPEMPWTEATGTSRAKALLGGRYVMEEVEMEMMGMPIQGLHILGFDKLKEEYISLWADSMSTWWVTARGAEGPDGKVEMKGTMIDIAGERPYRMVIEHREDGTVYSEMFDTIPPEGEVKVMEITSKKKG